MAAVFKALGNRHRLDIFCRLARCCLPRGGAPHAAGCACHDLETCVGDLGRDLGLAASTTSVYLAQLRRAGLIRMTRHGQSVHCCLEPRAIDSLVFTLRHAAGST